MQKDEFARIETYMLESMTDSSHDCMHIYRVLYAALEIAQSEEPVDYDILIAACLLHDIGREAQTQDLELDHAEIGGDMAYHFLIENHWDARRAQWVRACIASHRYRKNQRPESIEAKILFDADKLDVCGALGVARTLIYEGVISEPTYLFDEEGHILVEGTDAEISTFFQEFNYKLRHIYDRFYTLKATEMASKRKKIALDFYDHLFQEVSGLHDIGLQKLQQILED